MGIRRSFRFRFLPTATDTLEERIALSTIQPLPNLHNTPARLGPVGALGDSYTDEYRFYTPDRSQARNWVEMLHTLRLVNFGPYTTQSRGEPRNQGFAYDWARSDATSTTMIQNQLPGLTQQVAAGDIRYASIFIGGNDFFDFVDAVAAGLIPPQDIQAALTQTTTQLVTNVDTAVQTLLAANPNVKVVVWTLPSIELARSRNWPSSSIPSSPVLQAVNQATDQFNAFVTNLASSNPRIALADLATSVTQQLSGAVPNGTIQVAGTTIYLTVPGDSQNFFLADGLHPGTVGQGVIADTFVEAIDARFGTQLIPVTPQEIVGYAQKVQRTVVHPHGPQFP